MTATAPLVERLLPLRNVFEEVLREVGGVIVGQQLLLKKMVIGLLADGHVLLEGVPGLAKSLAVQTLAQALGGTFRRIQFTPDLLPADLLGTQIFQPKTGEWVVREGPIFGQFVLADEINRAPAKVQSALLEAMQERQVSLAGETRPLPEPFLVLATQNPVEHEGTYALPEAQVDRFMLKLVLDYPSKEEELAIVDRMARTGKKPTARAVTTPQVVLAARALLDEVHLEPRLARYLVDLVGATRRPADVGLAALGKLVAYGASPRASVALAQAGRAHAFLAGRDHVTPHDVKSLALDVLRHRISLHFEAAAEGVTAEQVVGEVLARVPVP
ncbi:MAG: AAA family ATPase [Planctomycetes bacterium]|nr:AAA family ATPase [Planctomycetota bacterium]